MSLLHLSVRGPAGQIGDGRMAGLAAAIVDNEPKVDACERLIVALNQPTIEAASELVEKLDGAVSFFKIGLQLQLMPGVSQLIEDLLVAEKRVFLDYKYFDTTETVSDAVSRAARMGITFLTVHGNGDIIRAAVKAKGDSSLKILSVTVLTSLDADDLKDLFGQDVDVMALVLYRARNAIRYGCDGVIASSQEAKEIKQLAGVDRLMIVTPGIRLDGASADDHKRVGAPAEAIECGADYLVVGRPIINAPDPLSAAHEYIDVMQDAFDQR